MQFGFKVHKLFALALQHSADGNAGPSADNVGYVVGRHLFFHQSLIALSLLQVFLNFIDLCLQRLQLAVANFGHAFIITFALSAVGFKLKALHLLLIFLDLIQEFALAFPFCAEIFLAFFKRRNLFIELRQLIFIILAFDGLALNLQLAQAACDFIQLFRLRITLHTQFGSCLIH